MQLRGHLIVMTCTSQESNLDKWHQHTQIFTSNV